MKNLAINSFISTFTLLSIYGLTACNNSSNATKDKQIANNTTTQTTLDKIKSSGEVVIGFSDSSIPFSYITDDPNQPIGFAEDLDLKIVDALKTKLNMPNLKVRYNLITPQTRMTSVQNGTIDFECESATNNKERQQQVGFSVGYFEIGTRLLTAKDSGIKDFPDLKGKRVVITSGSTSERYIRQYNEEKNMGMTIIPIKDHGEAILLLQDKRADAYMIDDIILAGERTKTKNPDDWVIVGTPPTHEIYGCMLRKGDNEFKKVVDDALIATYKSGEINNLYKKWFMSPIPPKNINLNFPMTEDVKELFQNPHDNDQPKQLSNLNSSTPKT